MQKNFVLRECEVFRQFYSDEAFLILQAVTFDVQVRYSSIYLQLQKVYCHLFVIACLLVQFESRGRASRKRRMRWIYVYNLRLFSKYFYRILINLCSMPMHV